MGQADHSEELLFASFVHIATLNELVEPVFEASQHHLIHPGKLLLLLGVFLGVHLVFENHALLGSLLRVHLV